MTSVVFFKDHSSEYVGFSVKGHAGYAEEGEDIVCSAVSSCCELVLNQLCDSFGYDVNVTIDPENAAVGCDSRGAGVNKESRHIISLILDGFRKTAEDIAEQYPRFVKCTITEV